MKKNSKQLKEKRTYPRLTAYHLAKYRMLSWSDKDKYVIASIKDISGGGISLLTDEDIPVSSIIQLLIQFPAFPKPIPSLAKVVWKKHLKSIKKFKMGLEFIEIEEMLRAKVVNRLEYVFNLTTNKKEKKAKNK